jgi:putative addiction module component (TIGR02574 family)
MTHRAESILYQALELPPIERAQLIEQLLSSFEFPARQGLDQLWAAEAETRIDAFELGKISTFSLQDAFDSLEKNNR